MIIWNAFISTQGIEFSYEYETIEFQKNNKVMKQGKKKKSEKRDGKRDK